MSLLTYTCFVCGDTDTTPLEVIDGENTCEYCATQFRYKEGQGVQS